MELNKHICTPEQEEELIELGFPIYNKIIICKYDEDLVMYDIILLSQAFEFMRDKYKIFASIEMVINNGGIIEYYHVIRDKGLNASINFKTYHEAQSMSLDKMIEVVKQTKN